MPPSRTSPVPGPMASPRCLSKTDHKCSRIDRIQNSESRIQHPAFSIQSADAESTASSSSSSQLSDYEFELNNYTYIIYIYYTFKSNYTSTENNKLCIQQ